MSDLKSAFRQLRKNPGFSAIAVLTLALGIGANTAIFTLIDQVMLRSLPVQRPEELVVVDAQLSYPRFQRLRDLNRVFAGTIGTHALLEMAIRIGNQDEANARGELVSGNYFATLGVGAWLGRTLLPEDDATPESSPVAVISHAFWQRAFGGRADILGTTIHVRSRAGNAGTSGLNIYDGAATLRSPGGAVLTIVGVAPPEFFGDTVGVSTDVWIPMMMQPAVMPGRPWLGQRNASWVVMMGRLAPGVTPEQAQAALTVLHRQSRMDEAGTALAEEQRRAIGEEVLIVERGGRGFGHLRGQFGEPLQILMVVVGLVLVMACLNVANLLMARGTARQHEFAVRLALGSGRARLLRQLLTECLLLGVIGGAVGLLVAFVGARALVALAASGYQTIQLTAGVDWRTLGFTGAVALLSTVLFGLAPALRATQHGLADTLKESSRATTGNRPRDKARRALITVQVAVSVVLLIGSGLFLQTLHNLRTQPLGYDPNGLVMMQLDPVSAGYRGDEIGRVCQTILERIAALPGVRTATFSENGLFYGPESGTKVNVEGFKPESESDRQVRFDQIGPGYFSRVGIPLLLGREITERDGPAAPRVAVINESMAKFYFRDANPIGRRITSHVAGRPQALEIVGVARDVQDHSLWWKPLRRFYVSYFQPIDGITMVNFAVRTSGGSGSLAAALRREVEAVDRNLTILNVRDLSTLMSQSLVQTRMMANLSTFFGMLGVILAVIGLSGIIAFDVVQRTKEIGLRLALGAQRSGVVGMIVKRGLGLVTAGVLMGLAGAAGLTRLVKGWLYGVPAFDPLTFLLVGLGFVAIALVACWWPARQAAAIDPMAALRTE